MRGKVYFVGAGPGAEDLLTIRAYRVLQQADVVLHDDLVRKEVVELLPRIATVLSVGKRCGRKGISQATLNQMMVGYALRGRMVVRLKCGDPSVFGRLGEEIEALRQAQVAFEIVPGVTAAAAAAAGAQISLTKRHVASQLVFATGTLADGHRQDWRQIMRPNTTVVIYMPGADCGALSLELRAAGVPPGMPCAIVSRAGTADETTRVSTLSQLSAHTSVPAPAVIIVGEVVRDRRACDVDVQFAAGSFTTDQVLGQIAEQV